MPSIKIFMLLLLVSLPCNLFAAENIRKISVTGKSETIVTAQYAVINLNVKTVKKEMNQSHAELMKSMTKLGEALEKIGLTEKDMRRSLILQGPEISWVKDTETLKGYYSQCHINLHVNDISKMQSVYRELSKFKNVTIDGTDFKRNDEFEIRKNEYEKALEAAKKKAEYMTQALQTKIGKVHLIQEFSFENAPHKYPAEAIAANFRSNDKALSETNAEYGNIKITALVTVEFELE